MGFSALCKSSDPLLEFIRKTYGAIPVSLPDSRWSPLAVFTVADGHVRYLGNVAELAGSGELPRVEKGQIPDVTHEKSSEMTWSAALGVAEPFLAAILGVGLGLELSAEMNRHRRTRVTISLGRATRRFCSAVAIASWLDERRIRLPGILNNRGPVYLVDSALYAKEFSVGVDADSAVGFTGHLEASIAGKVNPSLVLRSNSKVQITGVHPAAFGITCLQAAIDEHGTLRGVSLPSSSPKAAATDLALVQTVPHAVLGADNELMQFDD